MAAATKIERSGPAIRAVLTELAPAECEGFEAEFRQAQAFADADFDLCYIDAVLDRPLPAPVVIPARYVKTSPGCSTWPLLICRPAENQRRPYRLPSVLCSLGARCYAMTTLPPWPRQG